MERVSLPFSGQVDILSVTTAATGTNWTDFGSNDCKSLDIVNNSGTTIEYRRNGAGLGMPIPDGGSRLVIGISNSNQISVRRKDIGNTQVTVYAEAMD